MALEDDDEIFDSYLYDISDVTFDIIQKKNRREIALVCKAATADFNLIKFYLALKAYLEKVEDELNIMETAKGEH